MSRNTHRLPVGTTSGGGVQRKTIGTGAGILEILDALPFYVLLVDADHHIVLANKAVSEHLGVDPEDIVGKYCPKVVHGLDGPFPGCPLEEAVEKGHAIEQEFFDTETGRWMDSAIYPTNYRMQDGRAVFFRTARDITERKQMQDRLLALQRLATLGEFLGSVSHELRDPLTLIGIAVQWLKTKLEDTEEEVKKHLDRIDTQLDSCWCTIESLLSLAKMTEPRIESLDLISIAYSAIATSEVPETVDVVENLLDEEVLIDGDQEQLRMAFRNIVTNAVQAMEGKGTLTLTVGRTADDQAEVSLTDTGPGIHPENVDKVLEPLFSTRAEGTGLGLSIAKAIVEKHGGTIDAKSEPGHGATFIVRLPLHVGKGKTGKEVSAKLETQDVPAPTSRKSGKKVSPRRKRGQAHV